MDQRKVQQTPEPPPVMKSTINNLTDTAFTNETNKRKTGEVKLNVTDRAAPKMHIWYARAQPKTECHQFELCNLITI